MGQIMQNLLMFYALMEYSSDSIVFKEYFGDEAGGFTGGNFVCVSNEKARHYGMTPSQMRGKTDRDLLPPREAAKSLRDDLWVMAHRRAIHDIRETITHPDGETVTVSVTKFPWFNQGGEVFGVICIARDISRRIEAENESHRLNEFLMRELFQPLASIHGQIENLAPTPDNDRIRQVYGSVFTRLRTRLRKST